MLVGKPEDLEDVGADGGIILDVAQDRDQWQVPGNTVSILRVP
jgi:hypothetical protein